MSHTSPVKNSELRIAAFRGFRVRLSAGLLFLLTLATLHAGPAKVRKVLPHFLDLKGRHTLAPSLYERDAYQAHLRSHPDERSGIRFDIHWKAGITTPVELRLEARGTAEEKSTAFARAVVIRSGTGRSRWTSLTLTGTDYTAFGELHAWRVTVWDGSTLLAEQQSFLW